MKKQIVYSFILGTFFVPGTGVLADTIDSTKDSSFVEVIREETIESKQDAVESVISAEMVEVEAIEESILFTESEEINVPSEPELPEESTDFEQPSESEEATDSSSSEEIETPDESETPEVPSEPETSDESERDGIEQPIVPSELEKVSESTIEATPSIEEIIPETSEIQENRIEEEENNTENSVQSLEDEPFDGPTSQEATVQTLPKTGSQESTSTNLLGLVLSIGSFILLKKRNNS